ncbi:MAG: hypothetical protein SV760_00880 [Halobacteria archaeon]|nr:hypothetical protein [Halobacteria archaeon]
MLSRIVAVIAFLILGLVFAGLFYTDMNKQESGPVTTVVVSSEEIDDIKSKYISRTERAWCLYGEVSGRKVVIEEIVWDSKAEGTRGSVSFNCLADLPVPEGTKYLGHVHSHPRDSGAYPSAVDQATNRMSNIVVMGVYNGDDLNFYRGKTVVGALSEGVEYGGGRNDPGKLELRIRNRSSSPT